MSQASDPNNQPSTPITAELNQDVNHDDSATTSPEVVVNRYVNVPPEQQRGRPVLGYQIPPVIAENILTSLSLTLQYSYERERESVAAWRVEDTTKALIRYDSSIRDYRTWYMLPPLGETHLDLRWMLLQSVDRDDPITITYLEEETTTSILKTTRPEDREAIETLMLQHTSD